MKFKIDENQPDEDSDIDQTRQVQLEEPRHPGSAQTAQQAG